MKKVVLILMTITLSFFITACTPGVRVLPPEKPIEINMNVVVEQNVRVSMSDEIRDNKHSLSIIGVPMEEDK